MKKLTKIIIRIILSILVFFIAWSLCFAVFSKLRLSLNLDGQVASCPSCPDGALECLCYSTDAIPALDKSLNILYMVLQVLLPLGAVLLLNKFVLRKK